MSERSLGRKVSKRTIALGLAAVVGIGGLVGYDYTKRMPGETYTAADYGLANGHGANVDPRALYAGGKYTKLPGVVLKAAGAVLQADTVNNVHHTTGAALRLTDDPAKTFETTVTLGRIGNTHDLHHCGDAAQKNPDGTGGFPIERSAGVPNGDGSYFVTFGTSFSSKPEVSAHLATPNSQKIGAIDYEVGFGSSDQGVERDAGSTDYDHEIRVPAKFSVIYAGRTDTGYDAYLTGGTASVGYNTINETTDNNTKFEGSTIFNAQGQAESMVEAAAPNLGSDYINTALGIVVPDGNYTITYAKPLNIKDILAPDAVTGCVNEYNNYVGFR